MHLGWGLSFLSWTRCRFGWRSTTSVFLPVSSNLKPLLKNVVFIFVETVLRFGNVGVWQWVFKRTQWCHHWSCVVFVWLDLHWVPSFQLIASWMMVRGWEVIMVYLGPRCRFSQYFSHLLCSPWLKMNSWTHGVMRRRSAPHSSSIRIPSTHDLQPLPALFLVSKGEKHVRSPGHWVFSVWRRGCQMWASMLESFGEYVSGSWLTG